MSFSTDMLPLIARLAPEIVQEVDSYLSFPDQVFLRQANKAHLRNKLRGVQSYSIHQERIEYLVRKAFYARKCQRRSGRYSQDEIFCHGCLALRPAHHFDDLSRTFTGALPVTTEEVLRSGANRLCIICSLNLSPFDGHPEAYYSGQIILIDGLPLSRCLCCQMLQGDILRTRFNHHDYAIFRMGCPICGACASCSSLQTSHNCDELYSAHLQSLSMLVYLREYPTMTIPTFTTDVLAMVKPEYQSSVRRMRLACCKVDKIRKELLRRLTHRNRGGSAKNKRRRTPRR